MQAGWLGCVSVVGAFPIAICFSQPPPLCSLVAAQAQLPAHGKLHWDQGSVKCICATIASPSSPCCNCSMSTSGSCAAMGWREVAVAWTQFAAAWPYCSSPWAEICNCTTAEVWKLGKVPVMQAQLPISWPWYAYKERPCH